jgi:hypothetical protein
LTGEGPRYDRAAEAAAEIVNLHLGCAEPRAVLFARVLFCILHAMDEAGRQIDAARLEPSLN